MARAASMRLQQRGVALVVVLWVLLLLTVSTSAYTLMARMDGLEAHTVMWGTRARMAAEAGLNIATLSLRDPDETQRIIADGRPYEILYDEAVIEIKVTDERGKLNLNSIDDISLVQLFTANGLEPEQAEMLMAAIQDWKDTDELPRPNGAELEEYLGVGYAVGPANRDFVMVDELLQVLGMPFELYRAIEPGLTVWSDSSLPSPAYAPVEALVALPDMTLESAQEFVALRHSTEAGSGVQLELPNGTVAVEPGRGVTYSIVARATLPNGVWDQIEATIQLGSNQMGQPFKILRWQEGVRD